MTIRNVLTLFPVLFFLTACGASPATKAGAIGGVGGAAIGAGTGAAIGASIANGSVTNSALLGGAIGIPVGIAAGVTYQYLKEQNEIKENDEAIQQNFEYITARQQEIERLREELVMDSMNIKLDKSRRDYIFDGATIGTMGNR